MAVIYIDERTPHGKKMLAQLNKPKQRAIINPFPFSILEIGFHAFFDVLECNLTVFVNVMANMLRRMFRRT